MNPICKECGRGVEDHELDEEAGRVVCKENRLEGFISP